jgi:hypothetical protein
LSHGSVYITIAIVSLMLISGMTISISGRTSNARLEDLIPIVSRSNSISGASFYQPPIQSSLTFLNVITKIDNTNEDTNKQSSDFIITVSGISPYPKSLSGSSSGASVTSKVESYQMTEHNSTLAASPTLNRLYNITIASNSNSIYSIPSTFVNVDRFSTNYTIAGKFYSLNGSRELITSTIMDDFDKNPNIGYVVNSSQALNTTSQPGFPNPFVSKHSINQKITNEIHDAITTKSATNPPEKYVEIKCVFGMVLANYKCS